MNKSFTTLVFFLALSATSFDVVYAGPGRTGQTRQETLQVGRIATKQAQHFKKLNTVPNDRFERRHSHWQTTPSNGSKVLLVTLASLMLLMPTVTTAMTMDKPSVDKPSPIYSEDYWASNSHYSGPEERTFGSCEKLADNATLCRAIGSNYTITSCIHPSEAEYSQGITRCCTDNLCHGNCRPVSRCLSYNLDGVIGSQSKLPPVDRKAAYIEAKQKCTNGSRQIAQEIHGLLTHPKYQMTAFFPDRNVTMTTFGLDPSEGLQPSNKLPDGSKQSCIALGGPVKEKDLPVLFSFVNDLSKKMNIAEYNIPSISIYNDEECAPHIKLAAGESATQLEFSYFRRSNIRLFSSFLQKLSDAEIACVLAHELHHQNQKTNGQAQTNNNAEAEADLASLLTTHNPCIATFLSKYIKQGSFPLITSKNAANRLIGQSADDPKHPSNIMRQALVLIMDKRDKEATELLLADHNERIASQRASSSDN